ncbi:MAG: hypothetical protein HUJ65_04225, partial [Oscillospiraceae bacterium]|nr:hypothetical protein [Oscillospiraceae bacterium]
MDLKNYPRREYAIEQFTQAQCYELIGEKFFFVMDGGYDYELEITGKTTCLWNLAGEEPEESEYLCLKADDTTYLFTYELKSREKRTSHTYVIDKEQMLVTQLTCTRGLNPRFPFMVKSEYDFGAIKVEGRELTFKRHYFTGEILGTTVQWDWNTELFTQHAYLEPAYYRITWTSDSQAEQSFTRFTSALPSTDEPATYIKIK